MEADFIAFDEGGNEDLPKLGSSSSDHEEQGETGSSSSDSDGEVPAGRHIRFDSPKKRSPGNADDGPSNRRRKRKREESIPAYADLIQERIMDTKAPPWTKDRTYSSNLMRRLHEEIVDFQAFIEPSDEEHTLRQNVIDSIQEAVSERIYGCKLKPFGSFETRLYLPTSDIDMTLWLPSPPRDVNPILSRVASALRATQQFIKIECVRSARVPIVKAVHQQFGFHIDISIHQSSGLKTAELVKSYMRRYPALRPLALALKMFLFCRELHEVYRGGISSYTVITMILCLLQTHPLLVRKQIREESNLGILLMEWFELFSECFSHTDVVVVSDGFREKANEAKYLWNINPDYLSVRDPNDKSNDLARGSRMTPFLLRSFQWAYDTLKHVFYACNEKKRAPATILGLILHVHERILDDRRRLIEQYRIAVKLSEEEEAKKAEKRKRKRRLGDRNAVDDDRNEGGDGTGGPDNGAAGTAKGPGGKGGVVHNSRRSEANDNRTTAPREEGKGKVEDENRESVTKSSTSKPLKRAAPTAVSSDAGSKSKDSAIPKVASINRAAAKDSHDNSGKDKRDPGLGADPPPDKESGLIDRKGASITGACLLKHGNSLTLPLRVRTNIAPSLKAFPPAPAPVVYISDSESD